MLRGRVRASRHDVKDEAKARGEAQNAEGKEEETKLEGGRVNKTVQEKGKRQEKEARRKVNMKRTAPKTATSESARTGSMSRAFAVFLLEGELKRRGVECAEPSSQQVLLSDSCSRSRLMPKKN